MCMNLVILAGVLVAAAPAAASAATSEFYELQSAASK